MSQARIEIVSPMGNKGLGRQYLANDRTTPLAEYLPMTVFYDEMNCISIGAILYNEDGSVNQTAEMVITATDATQNKALSGTGTLWNDRYIDRIQRPAYYFPFEYRFKTVGDHIITFSADGQTESVTVNVPAEDFRN